MGRIPGSKGVGNTGVLQGRQHHDQHVESRSLLGATQLPITPGRWRPDLRVALIAEPHVVPNPAILAQAGLLAVSRSRMQFGQASGLDEPDRGRANLGRGNRIA